MNIKEHHHQMLNRYFDGLINDEERAELEALLLIDVNLRSQFWHEVNFSILLEEAAQFSEENLEKTRPSSETPAELNKPLLPRLWREVAYPFVANYPVLSMLVSGMVIITMLLVLWIVPELQPERLGTPNSTEFVAKISHASQASFDEMSDGNLIKRSLLANDRIVLNDGWAVVEYRSGARVVLEAPTNYQVLGDNQGDLQFGKLLARVPPAARGFTVKSPSNKVVDLGTEFGMIADVDGTRTDVHVCEGSVEVATSSDGTQKIPPRLLKAGQALSIERASTRDDSSTVIVHREVPINRDSFSSLSTVLAASEKPRPDGPSISIASVATANVEYDLSKVYGVGDWAYWEQSNLSGAPLNEKSSAELIGAMSAVGGGELRGSTSTIRPRHDFRFDGDGTAPSTGNLRNPIGLRNSQLDTVGAGVQVSVVSPTSEPFKIYVWTCAYNAGSIFTASVGTASDSDRSFASRSVARPGRLYTISVVHAAVGQVVNLKFSLSAAYGGNANVSLAAIAVDTPVLPSNSPDSIIAP